MSEFFRNFAAEKGAYFVGVQKWIMRFENGTYIFQCAAGQTGCQIAMQYDDTEYVTREEQIRIADFGTHYIYVKPSLREFFDVNFFGCFTSRRRCV